MDFDVIIIGAGPGGIFSAYELTRLRPDLNVAVFEAGHALNKRRCPIDGEKIKSCIGCKSCSIMSGFGGAGAFSDGNGIITVNGHSYEDPAKQTNNTNFALLVAKHFSEPFKDSNGYGESIARLSNMLGGGVIVQRFGDLIRGRRSNPTRIEEAFITPTLKATPGDLSLVLPKRILDGIIEMIYALDKIAPGTANDDTLLYGVEVKFYNMEVEVSDKLESCHEGLYIIGDGSGITHSLSHASASGVHVARDICGK